MQSQFGITPVASIARIESGVDIYAVGASVIARANDQTLLSLSDTAGHKVLSWSTLSTVKVNVATTHIFVLGKICSVLFCSAQLFSVQVTFAVKGAEFTALPWLVYEAIQTQGVDIFIQAAEVHPNCRAFASTQVPCLSLLLVLSALAASVP